MARGLSGSTRRTGPVLGEWTRPFTVVEKGRLIIEILRTYATAYRIMRRDSLHDAVAALRGDPVAGTGLEPRDEYRTSLRLGGAVQRTLAPLPTDSRCLVRSLVLTTLLARRGITSAIVIGVLPSPTFTAHAWVEYEGAALLPAGRHAEGRLTEV